MRWLVIFLIILNGVMFAWFVFDKKQQQAEQQDGAEHFDFSSVVQIQLLSELPELDLQQRDIRLSQAESRGIIKDVSASESACLILGPFLEVISARQAKSRLEEKGVKSSTVILYKELPPINWVYIAPQPDRKKALALLKDLQAKKIDSFLIADGEYENGISLGFFSNPESAKTVLEQRAKEGYPVSLAKKQREQKTFWLSFDHSASVRLESIPMSAIQESGVSIKRQQKSCSEVALLQIIE